MSGSTPEREPWIASRSRWMKEGRLFPQEESGLEMAFEGGGRKLKQVLTVDCLELRLSHAIGVYSNQEVLESAAISPCDDKSASPPSLLD